MFSRNNMTKMSYGIILQLECKILRISDVELLVIKPNNDKGLARTVVMRKGNGRGGRAAGSTKLTKFGND